MKPMIVDDVTDVEVVSPTEIPKSGVKDPEVKATPLPTKAAKLHRKPVDVKMVALQARLELAQDEIDHLKTEAAKADGLEGKIIGMKENSHKAATEKVGLENQIATLKAANQNALDKVKAHEAQGAKAKDGQRAKMMALQGSLHSAQLDLKTEQKKAELLAAKSDSSEHSELAQLKAELEAQMEHHEKEIKDVSEMAHGHVKELTTGLATLQEGLASLKKQQEVVKTEAQYLKKEKESNQDEFVQLVKKLKSEFDKASEGVAATVLGNENSQLMNKADILRQDMTKMTKEQLELQNKMDGMKTSYEAQLVEQAKKI